MKRNSDPSVMFRSPLRCRMWVSFSRKLAKENELHEASIARAQALGVANLGPCGETATRRRRRAENIKVPPFAEVLLLEDLAEIIAIRRDLMNLVPVRRDQAVQRAPLQVVQFPVNFHFQERFAVRQETCERLQDRRFISLRIDFYVPDPGDE